MHVHTSNITQGVKSSYKSALHHSHYKRLLGAWKVTLVRQVSRQLEKWKHYLNFQLFSHIASLPHSNSFWSGKVSQQERWRWGKKFFESFYFLFETHPRPLLLPHCFLNWFRILVVLVPRKFTYLLIFK